MKKGLTEIVCIIDRSGSMYSIKEEAQNGFNEFIKKQKKEKGTANVTLAQFDNEYDLVYNGLDIKKVKKYVLDPRGMTALLDAIGKTVNTVKERIEKTKKKDQPELVLVCILTDGCENASQEFKRPDIKKLIETQEKESSWEFIYLGANQDAFSAAQQMGIKMTNTSNFQATAKGALKTFSVIDTYATSYRSGEKGIQLDNADS